MAGASCAAGQLEQLWRLGETHGDRKVVGGGAIPLAPTTALCQALSDSSGAKHLHQLIHPLDHEGWQSAPNSLRARHCLESRHR